LREWKPEWEFPDWSKDVVAIVASGPSAKEVDLEPFKDKFKFLAVNNSWQLVPWADVLFAADGGWWQSNKETLEKFNGMKVTLDALASREMSIHLIKLYKGQHGISTDKRGQIGMGQNSGFYALNLAVQFGAKKIILVGYDMNIDRGLHWHGPHKKGLTNPNPFRLKIWAKLLDSQASILKKLGVEVVNASQVSVLTAYKKVSLTEALELWANKEGHQNVD